MRVTVSRTRMGTWIMAVAGVMIILASVALMAYAAPTRARVSPGDPGTSRGQAPAGSARDHGRLVSATHLLTLPAKSAVTADLAEAGFRDPGTVRYGVDAYRLVYRTVSARGLPTTASGLLALPRDGARRLRTVSYDHGTASVKGDVPSIPGDHWNQAPVITYAAAGFAAVAPGYPGLGPGPGLHPRMDVPSETTASLDMLRAARAFVPRTGRKLERQVLVTGFSRGASAAMGLARTLQRGADQWFRLGAVAPVSGAYGFRHIADSACTDWVPRVPVRLFLSTGDEQAADASTYRCAAALRAHGVNARAVNLGDFEYRGSRHLGSNVLGTAAVVRWFGTLH